MVQFKNLFKKPGTFTTHSSFTKFEQSTPCNIWLLVTAFYLSISPFTQKGESLVLATSPSHQPSTTMLGSGWYLVLVSPNICWDVHSFQFNPEYQTVFKLADSVCLRKRSRMALQHYPSWTSMLKHWWLQLGLEPPGLIKGPHTCWYFIQVFKAAEDFRSSSRFSFTLIILFPQLKPLTVSNDDKLEAQPLSMAASFFKLYEEKKNSEVHRTVTVLCPDGVW